MTGRKKLLLFGAHKSLINDFFEQLSDRFEMLSCSSRKEDIFGHLGYFDPDALVFCLYDERREDFAILERVKTVLKSRGSALVVAGDGSKCDEFERLMPGTADQIIRRSRMNTCPVMGMQLDNYLNSMRVFRDNKKGTYELMEAFRSADGADSQQRKLSQYAGTGDSLDDILAASCPGGG